MVEWSCLSSNIQLYVTKDWLMLAHTKAVLEKANCLQQRKRKPFRQMASLRVKINLQYSFILSEGINENLF